MLSRHGRSSRVIMFMSISGLLATGCNPFSKDNNNNNNNNNAILPQRVAPSDGVRWLLPEDPACLDGKSSATLSQVTIYEWDGTQAHEKQVAMSSKNDSDYGFQTKNIFFSMLGYEKNQTCTYDADGLNCEDDKTQPKNDLKALRICHENGSYNRDSIEAMTVTAQYFTELSYDFYNSITGNKSGIVKSAILTQPRLKMHITRTSDKKVFDRYEVDNAGFTAMTIDSLGKIGLFMIHPTSVKSFDKGGVNLWEVPFVMHHEFGHHVFRHYLGSTADSIGLRLSDTGSIDGILPRPKTRSKNDLNLTDSTKLAQDAADGINETFADLFAYFTDNGVKDQLKGVECLDTSRDPSSPLYTDGKKKGLDSTAIDMYEGRKEAGTSEDCATPNFDDSHDIAAALGQPIAQFIEMSFPNVDAKTRARVLLSWAIRLNTLFTSTKSNIRIDNIVRELVLSVKDNTALRADACAAFKANITGLPLATAACAL